MDLRLWFRSIFLIEVLRTLGTAWMFGFGFYGFGFRVDAVQLEP